MKMINKLHCLIVVKFVLILSALPLNGTEKINWRNEVVYHVMPRSFYDSNGDLHGDLNGFVQKLDYLESLGVTTILFTPLYESGFYHNYFPTDYMKIDSEYGTMADYIAFIKEIHKRGMKFIMDMETQYAQNGHIWFDDSYGNPESRYSEFIYYADSLNKKPQQLFFVSGDGLAELPAWHNEKFNVVALNLNNPELKSWMSDFYAFWLDPNNDGIFDDGVDGFRIDHIMDDLDYKGTITNMYKDFWNPIFTRCRSINPNIFFVGEQADWGTYGDEMVKKSGADAAFSFPLRFAITGNVGGHDSFGEEQKTNCLTNPQEIHEKVLETIERFPAETYSFTFIENHDTDRWASLVDRDEEKVKNAAVLVILLPGIPSIYYGQELGITGQPGNWNSDANHLPVREAFPWSADYEEPGLAVFYKNTGEWWDQSIYTSGDAKHFTYASQKNHPESVWNHYHNLIEIRKSHNAFRNGDYTPLLTDDKRILAFKREYSGEQALVLINLTKEQIVFDSPLEKDHNYKVLLGGIKEDIANKCILLPSQFVVLSTHHTK